MRKGYLEKMPSSDGIFHIDFRNVMNPDSGMIQLIRVWFYGTAS